MKTRRSFLTVCLGVSCLVAGSGITTPVGAGEAKTKLAIVVSKDSPVSEISFYELKRLYMGEQINASGKRLLPLNLTPNSRERGAFDKTVLSMSPEAIARYWVDRKIRGDSGPPKTIEPLDLLQRVVARLDGAIGYAPLNAIRPELKTLRIDGKAPGDVGYPLEF
ncbi:MAG TPA: hypothetical protein VJV79_27475 [Polyangiaceae bacterium]|nr:hypothetical protein [Polyangiaceae bacterium]